MCFILGRLMATSFPLHYIMVWLLNVLLGNSFATTFAKPTPALLTHTFKIRYTCVDLSNVSMLYTRSNVLHNFLVDSVEISCVILTIAVGYILSIHTYHMSNTVKNTG